MLSQTKSDSPARTALRTLALRVPAIDGEALDSWVEACCRRHRLTLGEFYRHMSMPGAGRRDLVTGVSRSEIERLALAGGMRSAQIESMTVSAMFPETDGYTVTPVATDYQVYPRPRAGFWLVTRSSRFCPQCLTEDGGRWQLGWRSRWAFACRRHHCLLVDTCPQCGSHPRRRRITQLRLRGGSCDGANGRYGGVCQFVLGGVQATALDADSPILCAQARIDTLLRTERDPSPSTWAPSPLLHDVAYLARQIILAGDITQIDCLVRGSGAAILELRETGDMARNSTRNFVSSFVLAPTIALALGVLDCAGIDEAARRLHELLPLPAEHLHCTNLHLEMNAWARRSVQVELIWNRLRTAEFVPDSSKRLIRRSN
ncbi:regulatory helix-turn-helix protein, lysR family [Mycobacteroides abscessus subsp. abscessus]|nr:regulatory helix-turn-helix protein, lysR family [Mycobacteroides abscessus subsp. abscessus]